MSLFNGERTTETIEQKHLDFRELLERAYRVSPVRTQAELVHMGYWLIAAQLKIDYDAGCLA